MLRAWRMRGCARVGVHARVWVCVWVNYADRCSSYSELGSKPLDREYISYTNGSGSLFHI